jgi:hypothetical protein
MAGMVRDHKWHKISYDDLPQWVKNREYVLKHKQLVGKTFRYRLNWNTHEYERRLRYRVPVEETTLGKIGNSTMGCLFGIVNFIAGILTGKRTYYVSDDSSGE